jgi:hypothetical protein
VRLVCQMRRVHPDYFQDGGVLLGGLLTALYSTGAGDLDHDCRTLGLQPLACAEAPMAEVSCCPGPAPLIAAEAVCSAYH